MQDFIAFVSQHWLLAAAFVVILFLIIANEFILNYFSAKSYLPQEVIKITNADNKAQIIDIRSTEEFKKGHITNSLNLVDLTNYSKNNNAILIIVCENGRKSSALAQKFKKQYVNIAIMKGGISNWKELSLPLVEER